MYKILIFSVSLLLGSVSPAPEQLNVQLEPEKMSAVISNALKCVAEIGGDVSGLITKIKEKNYSSDDETSKNFIFCMAKHLGLLSKKGELKTNVFANIYPNTADRGAITKVVEQCKQEHGTETRDKFFNFFRCYQKNTPVRILLNKDNLKS